MLNILGGKQRFCDGVSRRNFLKIGGLALGGLSLPQILHAEEAAGIRKSNKAVIMVYLPGGPPHQDLVDLKPDAPSGYKSPYKPIKTNIPGIEISEHMPRMAKMMDQFTIVRSLVGARNEHASNLCLTGYAIGEDRQHQQPSLGSAVSRIYGAADPAVPPFVELIPRTSHAPYSNPGQPGYLGLAYSGVRTDGQVMQDLTLKGITLDRLGDRQRLLSSLNRYRKIADASGVLDSLDGVNARAFDMLTSSKFVKAMDVTREDPKLRDRYGRGSSKAITDAGQDWNDQFLVARRLVEAGVRCVTIGFGGWDYHQFWNPQPGPQSGRLDQALSALVQDLNDRGLSDDVSVVAWGDFGRTPRFNKQHGRDHWPTVSFAILAGGGMRHGQVIGSTNKLAEHADERPVHYRDVFATLYHNMGIDVRLPQLRDPENRPRYLVQGHLPIEELI